jgi:hypothetical protein
MSASPDSQKAPDSLAWYVRLLLIVVGTGLLALLALAVYLPPSERGYGTHQQLGLPPCSFQQLFGCRCPSCGMTTAWSNTVRGRLFAAVRANAAGTVLCLAALVCMPVMLVSGIRGRWVVPPPSERTLALAATFFVVITLVDWAIRLWWY